MGFKRDKKGKREQLGSQCFLCPLLYGNSKNNAQAKVCALCEEIFGPPSKNIKLLPNAEIASWTRYSLAQNRAPLMGQSRDTNGHNPKKVKTSF